MIRGYKQGILDEYLKKQTDDIKKGTPQYKRLIFFDFRCYSPFYVFCNKSGVNL
jgi:hypothetical protein